MRKLNPAREETLVVPSSDDCDQADAAGCRAHDCAVIGFVNNMSDAALRTAEKQFRALLSAHSPGHYVHVRRFFLPEIGRSREIRGYLERHYESIDRLWNSHVDGLIVTGAEPRAQTLTHEPFWSNLTRLVDWADRSTISSVWSCLAAHAAVLQADGIERCALGGKLSGVFDCQKIADHPLVAGTPPRWRIPHSRYNGLPQKAMEAVGYQMLSLSKEAGADLFIKQRTSLFVFLQGHPEYEPDALFREYRRDIMRFLSGERDTYPEAPRFYFDDDTTRALHAFRLRALKQRTLDLLADLPSRIGQDVLARPWMEPTRAVFANWITYIIAEKKQKARTITAVSNAVGNDIGLVDG